MPLPVQYFNVLDQKAIMQIQTLALFTTSVPKGLHTRDHAAPGSAMIPGLSSVTGKTRWLAASSQKCQYQIICYVFDAIMEVVYKSCFVLSDDLLVHILAVMTPSNM